LFTSDSTRLVSVRVADCCPVLLATADGAVVAAIHAGWRGVVAGVLPATLAALIKESGAAPATICAAIGPCIGREAFEVGTDVLDEFRRVFGTRAPIEVRPNGKGRADIRAGLRLQLLECGVPEEQLDSLELCTVDNPLEFFSHRRDRGLTGRMAALIGPA
jgi:YfiH family protein